MRKKKSSSRKYVKEQNYKNLITWVMTRPVRGEMFPEKTIVQVHKLGNQYPPWRFKVSRATQKLHSVKFKHPVDKSFLTKRGAISFAKNWMRKHPRG